MTWTEKDVPDESGRVAIVTGSNTGLGYDTARVLAARGARVVMAVRDTAKGDAAAARIRELSKGAEVTVHELDLGSLASVRAAASQSRPPRWKIAVSLWVGPITEVRRHVRPSSSERKNSATPRQSTADEALRSARLGCTAAGITSRPEARRTTRSLFTT